MTERLLTAREVGELFGLSTDTILNRFERGDLPGFRLFGKKGGPVRFKLSELEDVLKGWHVNGPEAGGEVSPAPTTPPTRRVVLQPSPVPPPGGEHAG